MNVQPVIQRELQVAARRAETWRLRQMFVAGGLLAFAFGMLWPDIPTPQRGLTVLVCLAIWAFALCLYTGPYLTADAVSAEKRDGTLGLLFLTPLNGWEIVLGKTVTHSLQVGYALLGGFPVLFLPVLMGGVVWSEVTRLVIVLLTTLLLSLACGMFWSVIATEARTTVLAAVVSLLLLTALPWGLPFLEQLLSGRSVHLAGLPQVSPVTSLIFAFEDNFRMGGRPRLAAASGAFLYWGSVACNLACGLGLLAVSGRLLPRVWRQTAAAGPRVPRAGLRAGCATAGARRPRWLPRRDAAPLVWLAGRGLREPLWLTLLRTVIVLLFAVMLVVSVTTEHWAESFTTAFCATYALHLVTKIQFALAATKQLHEDRRSGALELLLITPTSEAALIQAHHQALRRAFRKPLGLLFALNAALQLTVVLFARHLHVDDEALLIFSPFFVGGALQAWADSAAIRWLALREALRSTTHLKAVGRVLVWLMAFPWPTFPLVFLVSVRTSKEAVVAALFAGWALCCLLYDGLLVLRCRYWYWLGDGLRRRVAEG